MLRWVMAGYVLAAGAVLACWLNMVVADLFQAVALAGVDPQERAPDAGLSGQIGFREQAIEK
jgi:hypothetical protein